MKRTQAGKRITTKPKPKKKLKLGSVVRWTSRTRSGNKTRTGIVIYMGPEIRSMQGTLDSKPENWLENERNVFLSSQRIKAHDPWSLPASHNSRHVAGGGIIVRVNDETFTPKVDNLQIVA